jgi:predicted SAM-dependent methyltransferase
VLKYNLGGIGVNGPEYKTVNLAAECDIHEDILNLDNFCSKNSVDEFYLSHTLEHIPVLDYKNFLHNMKDKLKVGGVIRVVQTDAGKIMKMWTSGKVNFRTMRSTIFTPATRCDSNILQQHQSMWSQEELIRDFEFTGMQAEGFDAGFWYYDMEDDIFPEDTSKCQGVEIPNLGVIAKKI